MLSFIHNLSRRTRIVLAVLVFCFVAVFLVASHPPRVVRQFTQTQQNHEPRPTEGSSYAPNAPTIACVGPRGGRLDEPGTPDLPQAVSQLSNVTFPRTTAGSYEAIGLEKSWMTFDDRYGPYGYGEKKRKYGFPKVDWDEVNWGSLQHDCLVANKGRFGKVDAFNPAPRFKYMKDGGTAPAPNAKTRRQAIVLRTWSTYEYQEEDMWNIRAIVAEGSLANRGGYDVVLLVDVKDEDNGPLIHENDDVYQEVLEASVPKEFRDIAVLFHYSLQLDWYAKVNEVRPMWQIMQPLQLFAHFYPEYDHYWQFELDTRFTGDVGKMLRAYDNFGRNEPYKQARERASWAYIPEIHGSYEDFSKAINKALEGKATVWGPIEIKNFEPIAPPPSVKHPEQDEFKVGVGQDADLLLMGPLNKINWFESDEDWDVQKLVLRWLRRRSRTLLVCARSSASKLGPPGSYPPDPTSPWTSRAK